MRSPAVLTPARDPTRRVRRDRGSSPAGGRAPQERPVAVCMRAKSAPEGCPSRVVDARRRPPIVHSLHHLAVRPQRRCGRPSRGLRRPPGCRHGTPDRSPARGRARAARRRHRPGRACGRCSPSPRWSTPSTRPTRPTVRATAASTCSARSGQPVLAALPGAVTYAGSLAGRGVVVVDHGATRTTYEPVAATVTVGTPVAAGTPDRHPRARRVALLPAGLPALGLDRGRDLPRPAPPGRRRAGPAAAALARRAGGVDGASRSRVGLAIRRAQPVSGDVGVELRRRQ